MEGRRVSNPTALFHSLSLPSEVDVVWIRQTVPLEVIELEMGSEVTIIPTVIPKADKEITGP